MKPPIKNQDSATLFFVQNQALSFLFIHYGSRRGHSQLCFQGYPNLFQNSREKGGQKTTTKNSKMLHTLYR